MKVSFEGWSRLKAKRLPGEALIAEVGSQLSDSN
jgi:hypothetical protein